MDTYKITQIIIGITLVIWISWDIYVATNKTSGDTESEVIRDYTKYPIIPSFLGTIAGHWTLLGVRMVDSLVGFWILLGIGAILSLWSVLVHNKKGGSALLKAHNFVVKRPYIPFIISYILGGFLWGMQPVQI